MISFELRLKQDHHEQKYKFYRTADLYSAIKIDTPGDGFTAVISISN
jgi:hypothetical protein